MSSRAWPPARRVLGISDRESSGGLRERLADHGGWLRSFRGGEHQNAPRLGGRVATINRIVSVESRQPLKAGPQPRCQMAQFDRATE
jgi:hypothetical protein